MERATTGKKISHFFSLSAKRLCAGTFSLPLPHPFTNEQKKVGRETHFYSFFVVQSTTAEVCSMLYRIADYFLFMDDFLNPKSLSNNFI